MSILGNRVLRKEDPKFLTTGGTYVDDLPLPGAAHVTYVRSTMAHANITAIDVSEARNAPGVLGIYTADDVDLEPMAPSMPMINMGVVRPVLAKGRTLFVGNPVAAIVTEEKSQGPDAAELVFVDYEPLPVIVDPAAALEDGAPILHPDVGTNISLDMSFGTDPSLMDGCDVVVSQRIVNQRVAPCPLEVRAAAAKWDD